MDKPVIAVDIDDVLADSTESLRQVVNKRLGVNLQPHHYKVPGEYWGYYESVWQANGIGGQVTMDDLDPQMKADQSHVPLMADAKQVLTHLSEQYDLLIVSARSFDCYDATLVWIEQNIPGVFGQVVFADGYKGLNKKHKGALCREVGATWLIDDNIEHAETAIAEGLSAIIFGEYGWHHIDLPDRAVACKNWKEVAEYFGV